MNFFTRTLGRIISRLGNRNAARRQGLSRSSAGRKNIFRPALECLEERLVPTTYVGLERPAGYLEMTVPATFLAGVPSPVTLTVMRENGTVATDDTDTFNFTTSDSTVSGLPSSYIFTTANQGTHTFEVTFDHTGSKNIQAVSVNPYSGGRQIFLLYDEEDMQVGAGPVNHFVMSAPSTITAGQPFSVTVTAQDAYDNTLSSGTFTVKSFNGDTTGLTSASITSNPSAGTFTLSGTPNAGGTVTFTLSVFDSTGTTLTQTFALSVVSLPFSDNFNSTTNQQLSAAWINQVGNYSVNTTADTATGNGSLDLATLVGLKVSDVAVQATINVSAGQYAGLVADYSGNGDQNYYLGGVAATATGYEAYLYRNVNGVFTPLFTQNDTGSADGVLRLEAYGSSLKVFLGSTLIAYGDDSTFTGGSVGMRVTVGAAMSSFSASALSAGTPSLPFTDYFTITSPEPNQLTSNWMNEAGNFRVNTTSGTATGNGSLDLATLIGINASNVAVQATINVSPGQYAGLVADYTGNGDQNYYLGGVVANATGTGYEAYLYRNVNGVFTALFTQNDTGSANGVLRLEVYDSSLKVFLGSTLIAYGNSSTLTAGSVGMRVTAGAAVSGFSASVLTAGTPGLPFTDNFTTLASPEPNQLTSNWINQVGNYSVNTTSGTATGNGPLDLATLVGLNASDVAVQATINVSAGQYAGLVADHTGSGDQNYYLGGVVATASGYEAYLYRNVNGVFTPLFTQNHSGSADGVLRLEVYDSSLKLFLGSTLIAYGNSSTLTAGSVGMRVTAGAAVSGFSAGVLTAGTPGLPFTDNFTTLASPEPNQLTSNWINQVGNYSVNTTKGTATGNGPLDLATLVGLNATDVADQATINVSAGQYAGLVADSSGSGDQNYYLGGVLATATGYEAYLYVNLNGVFTALSINNYSGSANGVLRFEVFDSYLELFLNNTLIASAIDSTLTSGSVGMRVTAGATVSDFSASA